ncbi:MAG: FAD-binding oxidoreductase, partial [Bacteroidia bacterium]
MTIYNKIKNPVIKKLQHISGEKYVLFDAESLKNYGHDETEDFLFLPEVVIKPRTAQEISEILKLANDELISVTPRGAGTGLSGGALPIHEGIILSMERFNEIIEIDERNLQATVEPGVINEVFQNAVKALGLFYPPDPASKGSCFLGGNVAESSGGPKCVKYGTTKDYILNLYFTPTSFTPFTSLGSSARGTTVSCSLLIALFLTASFIPLLNFQ